MKKKVVIIGVVSVVIVASILLYINSRTLIQMRWRGHGVAIGNGEAKRSEASMVLDEETEITFIYRSEVHVGVADIILKDENDTVIRKVSAGEKGKEKIVLKQGKYSVRVESDYFKGTYHIRVMK